LAEAAGLGLAVAAVTLLLEAWFGLDQSWVYLVVFVPAIAGLMLVQRRRKIARPNWPDPDRQHVPMMRLAMGGWGFVVGLALVSAVPEGATLFWVGCVMALMGLAVALPGAAWQVRQAQAARSDPSQVDERAKANQSRATGWGFLAMLEVALIGGLLDMNAIWPLSGAQVGLAAGSAGILVAITGQAYLEWMDAA
jgi:hypothetical protein